MMNRRNALKTAALASAASAVILPGVLAQTAVISNPASAATGPFKLPPLGYPNNALEPFIDARTMEIHHDKHHAAYVANLNKAMASHPDLSNRTIEELLRNLETLPEDLRTAVRNQGGGHYNHSLFWQTLKINAGGEPKGPLAGALNQKFGNFNAFKEQFTKAAIGQFGSGWAWLVIDEKKQLNIEASANQDSPLTRNRQPLLGVDVWEHAYYLKYQNRRPDYVSAFFQVINWDFVGERYQQAAA